jgi:precorrin-6B methylase 1
MAADITIVGAGLVAARQLGAAADEVLRAARIVFCSNYNTGIADHVRALNPAATIQFSEENEYVPGMYRPDMYQRMADAVLNEAADRQGGVVMLAPGSAVVVDLVTQLILEGARAAHLGVQVLPGISSIESVLAEMQYDVSDGLQVVLAQKLVLRRIALNPSIASIILQPAYYDTLFYVGAPRSAPGRFDALEQHLARTFGSETPMALVITATESRGAASVFWFRFGDFGQLGRVLLPRHTLFVPPPPPPMQVAQPEAEFAARIASWPACLSRVEVGGNGKVLQQNRRDIAAGLGDLPPQLQAESVLLAEQWEARTR